MSTQLDRAEIAWTRTAAQRLSSLGYQVREEPSHRGSGCRFTFCDITGRSHYCAAHASRQLAFMHGCWSVLARIGNPHVTRCPRFFVS